MFDFSLLKRMNWNLIILTLSLMILSLFVISSQSLGQAGVDANVGDAPFFTYQVLRQLKSQCLGWGVFMLAASFDYNKLREWTWFLYLAMITSLVAVLFTTSIVNVHRWFQIPIIGMNLQPAEYAKLVIVIALSWFFEKSKSQSHSLSTALWGALIVFIPFLLILKEPDLGSALVLCPTLLGLYYFAEIHKKTQKVMIVGACLIASVVFLIFSGLISHEEMRPYALKFIQEYQYERLNPDSYHGQASMTAMGVGGIRGTGWHQGIFSGHGWLPEPYTDSVFAAFGEEFGLIGMATLIFIYYLLLSFSIRSVTVAKDSFGQLLAAGICLYLGIHVMINLSMLTGLFPITGVPLPLMTYGGSNLLATMLALGISQSIYIRRFTF